MHWFQLAAQILLLVTVVAMLFFAAMFYRNRQVDRPRPPGARTRRGDFERWDT